MKSLLGIAALILTVNASSAWAQYIGPNGSPTSVQKLLELRYHLRILLLPETII